MYTIEDFVDPSQKIGVSFVNSDKDELKEFLCLLDPTGITFWHCGALASETKIICLDSYIWHGLVTILVDGEKCIQGGSISHWEKHGYAMIPCIEFLKGNKPNFNILEYNSLIEN